jgi:hypothetical protein
MKLAFTLVLFLGNDRFVWRERQGVFQRANSGTGLAFLIIEPYRPQQRLQNVKEVQFVGLCVRFGI